MRKSGRLATLLVAALMLAGCASIPESGSVHAGDVSNPDSALEVDILARDPEKGASQEDILRGFVDAAASPSENYSVARKYLTAAFADKWNPDAGATVDDGTSRDYSSTGDDDMTLSVSPVAELSAHGQYAEVASSTPTVLSYQFSKVDGQWRIDKAPQGVIIDQPTFVQVFGSYPLYFYDPTLTYLVPDLRWFPRRTSTSSQVVRELLAGPSDWMKDAVISAFPEGSALSSTSVPVISRVAQVDLNSDAVRVDQGTLQRMKQQLRASLLSIPTITDVAISTNQIDQEIPDPSTAAVIDPGVDSRALVVRGKAFGYLASTGEQVSPVPGLSDAVVALNPTAITLGVGGSAAAVLSSTGVSIVRPGSGAVLLDKRAGLIAPAIDSSGIVWSVPRDDPTALRVYGADGAETRITAPWPAASSIAALRLSRDGTRLIALLEIDGHSSFVASSVVRGGSGEVPTSLDPTLALATSPGQALDAAWVDDLTVVSLTAGADGSTTAVAQELGGPSSVIEGADGADVVAGGNSTREMRMLDSDGTLYERRGIGWQMRIDGVGVLATQQGF